VSALARTHLALCGVALLAACGDDAPKSAPRAAAPAVNPATPSVARPQPGAPGAPLGPGQKAPSPLFTYPKAPDKFRVTFTPDMFEPDPTGDKNRDPFRSYLVEETQTPGKTPDGPRLEDECKNRTVADAYGLRDLHVVGIVKKGTTAYALFVDTQGFGHIAKRGDCLSKDKARIKEIGTQSITVEIRGDAPPGAPAPTPREEEWKLHPEALDLGAPGQPR
jgi:hypothetical protein